MDNSSPIVPRHYDKIEYDGSAAYTDIYTYFIGGVVQGTVTVLYTDPTKSVVSSVTRI